MQNQKTKTYLFNSFLNKDTILEKLQEFKNEEKGGNNKYIILTIQLLTNNKKEIIELEIISDYNINIQRKQDKSFHTELNRQIQFVNKYAKYASISSNIDIKTIKFNEIKFLYTPITYYQFVNKDEIVSRINKMIKK